MTLPPQIAKVLNTPTKQYAAAGALVLAFIYRKKLKKMF